MARLTPDDTMPCTQSTLSCSTSLRRRSIESFGLVSSSTMSSTLRPAMPPAALMRSTANCVPRRPHSPMVPAMPALGAMMPIAQRRVLRDRREAQVRRRGGGDARAADRLQQFSALAVHGCSSSVVGTAARHYHMSVVSRVNFSMTSSSLSLAFAARSSSPAAMARAISACSFAVSGMSAACL